MEVWTLTLSSRPVEQLRLVQGWLLPSPPSECHCLSTSFAWRAESSLSQPQMMVMSDVEDPFVPLPDELLVNLSESRAVVDALLDSLPVTFAANAEVGVSSNFQSCASARPQPVLGGLSVASVFLLTG